MRKITQSLVLVSGIVLALVACAESNVITFVNSILGARTNRYAGPLELLASIAGRVPH